MLKFFLTWLLRLVPIAYMILVWTLSSLPHNAVVELPNSSIDRFLKESLHLIEFAILYLMLVLAAFTSGRFSAKINLLCALIAALYGVVDEIHQSFVPYRSATLIDVIKDVAGVLVAYYFVHKAAQKNKFQQWIRYFNQ